MEDPDRHSAWDVVNVVQSDFNAEDEPLGTKEKFWVENPDDETAWLFKFVRQVNGRVLGEDWAEWIVCQVAQVVGVPAAVIRPAVCEERRGIVSRSVVPQNGRLVHGNSVMAARIEGYDTTTSRNNPAYTPSNVATALTDVASPATELVPAGFSAYDVWAGYLLLDALVAGRDRHHENWGVISTPTGRFLAASYDHGNALGFQEHDEQRQRCLDSTEALERWAARGCSHHFAGKPALVSLAHEALSLTSPAARDHWGNALEAFSEKDVEPILEAVPGPLMSGVTRTFVSELLLVNRRRLLDDYPTA
ncbi:hypothetical protein [uncultured Plantibacter sp.]|uniref:hypothetical protein n=1 Tax=uncultured Plantibacter sp. TaxID=293337 RepID=UPI0028D822DB|nr:hypothetical protein [uncultured Plantibacter sp.]